MNSTHSGAFGAQGIKLLPPLLSVTDSLLPSENISDRRRSMNTHVEEEINRAMSLASRVNNHFGATTVNPSEFHRACHSATSHNVSLLNRVPDQRKIELVQMVRL